MCLVILYLVDMYLVDITYQINKEYNMLNLVKLEKQFSSMTIQEIYEYILNNSPYTLNECRYGDIVFEHSLIENKYELQVVVSVISDLIILKNGNKYNKHTGKSIYKNNYKVALCPFSREEGNDININLYLDYYERCMNLKRSISTTIKNTRFEEWPVESVVDVLKYIKKIEIDQSYLSS